jgi:hypothetical protein
MYQSEFHVNMAASGRWKCLTGDTQIPLMNGTTVRIDSLVGKKDFYVYSYDFNKGHVVPGLCKGCAITGHDAKIVKITLDNGESFKCTPEHRIMKRNGHYIEAKDISEGDSLMPLYRRTSGDGYEEVYLTNLGVWKRTHHLSQDMIYGDDSWKINSVTGERMVSHHKDFNKDNNDPRNLCRLSLHEHWRYHSSKGWKAAWAVDSNRTKFTERARADMTERNKSDEYRNKLADGIREFYSDPRKSKRVRDNDRIMMKGRNSDPEYQAKCSSGHQEFFADPERSKDFRENAKEHIKICLEKRNTPEYQANKRQQAAMMAKVRGLNIGSRIIQSNGFINKDIYNSVRRGNAPKWDTILGYFDSEESMISAMKSRITNHKVVSIEYLDSTEEFVYDLDIETYHNFAIGAGIIVHNSGFHTLSSTVKYIYTSRFKGGVIAAPDASACEVKVLAAQAHEQNLLDAIAKGLDLHRFTASKIYHCTEEEVTKLQRKRAKSAVFGLIYGESVRSFADSNCNGNMAEANAVYDELFGAFPGIKGYIDDAHNQYLTTGKVILPIVGRFISVDDMGRSNSADKDKVLRQSQNCIIQGTAGDICGSILYKIFDIIAQNNLKSKPFCYIHDSIEIDIHPEELFRIINIASYAFNKYPSERFDVPISSDVVIGPSMGQEIDVSELLPSKDFNEAEITLKGFKDDIDEIEEIWKGVYRIVDRDTEFDKTVEPVVVKVPREGLFQKKVNLSMKMGTERYEIKRKYKIKIK